MNHLSGLIYDGLRAKPQMCHFDFKKKYLIIEVHYDQDDPINEIDDEEKREELKALSTPLYKIVHH